MLTKKIRLILLIAFLSLGLAVTFLACGDDDDDDDNDDTTTDDDEADDDTADDDTADDDVVDDDVVDDDVIEPGTIGGTVLDFLSENPIPGASVEALDDSTGESFDPAVTGTSDGEGKIQLTLPVDYALETVGIRVLNSPEHKPTVQYHFVVGLTDERFLAISVTTFGLMSTLLGLDPDPAKGHASGAVYWGDPTNENPIGCAEVTMTAPSDGVFYFNNLSLPTHGRDITTPGDPQNGEGTNPENGYFVGINADPGSNITITANADGAVSTAVIPQLFADTVCIATVYYSTDDYSENPQGDWCTEK
jgi:hypothetical protein